MAFKGRSFTIKHNGIIIGGVRTKSLVITNNTVDASSDDDNTWRVLSGDTGERFMTLTGSGIFIDDSAIKIIQDAAESGNSVSLVVNYGNSTLSYDYLVTNFEYAGEYNGAQIYNITLEVTLY